MKMFSAFVLVQLPGFEAPIQSDYWVLSYRMLSTAQGLSYKQKDALEVVGGGFIPCYGYMVLFREWIILIFQNVDQGLHMPERFILLVPSVKFF